MGRGAIRAVDNPWYKARIDAAKYDTRFLSREGAAEVLGMSVSSVADAELGLAKVMPVDKAVLMADAYGAPELLNHYCLNECPIGCHRPIVEASAEIEMASLRLSRILRTDTVKRLKHAVEDIAADGKLTGDELASFGEIVDELREISKIISELELIRDKAKSREDKVKGCAHGRVSDPK